MPNPVRRRKRRPGFPGIEVRISTINGPIVLADSEQLYYAAKYSGAAADYCTPACSSSCTEHGWLNLVAGMAAGEFGMMAPGGEFSTVPLKIEIRPVLLAGR